jgi:c-di-GMP-binding flagellar brake protein YcgR
MKEKRRYPRVSKKLSIKLFSSEFDIVTETKNISGNGVYCAIDKPLPVMTKLNILLLIPFKKNRNKIIKKISCNGVVVRGGYIKDNGRHSYYVGIYFNDIKEKDRRVLLSYINSSFNSKESIQS